MNRLQVYACALTALLGFPACSEKKSNSGNGEPVTIVCDTITLPVNDEDMTLMSYSAAQFLPTPEGDTLLLAFNYKTNCIDRFNLSNKTTLRPIVIDREGSNGIPGEIIWFEQFAPDSLVATNGMGVYLLDTVGRVLSSQMFPNETFAFVSRNAGSHTALINYNSDTHNITYPSRGEDSMSLNLLNILSGENKTLGELPGWTGEMRGFMLYPNVTFTNDTTALVAFPYSPAISIYSGNKTLASTSSAMSLVPQEVKKSNSNPDELMWHGFENPHYAEVMPVCNGTIYLQVVLGATNETDRSNPDQMAFDRNTYLRVLDSNLNTIEELDLGAGEINPFSCWLPTTDGIIFFCDSPLNPHSESEIIMRRYTVSH